MNVEQNRLETFSSWPSNSPGDPQKIARAGFYATQQGYETECFSCHIKISSWHYGDKVMTKHKYLSPQCPFILNPLNSGNVPILRAPRTMSVLNYEDEATRLNSFANWPIPNIVTAESLAKSGFYYLGRDDKTKCAFCNGVVRCWEEGDIPDIEHRKHFPMCRFVNDRIVPRLQNQQDNVDSSAVEQQQDRRSVPNINMVGEGLENDSFNNLGVHKHVGPKRGSFATLDSRINSFTNWSPNLIQTPEILAQAGFYYEGENDEVRCFHCDGGLAHWDPVDDPWTEHAKWFPNCSYVKLMKGQEFVNTCNANNPETITTQNKPNKIQSRQIGEGEIQNHMNSPAALAALSIGIDIQRVKRAIKEKLEQTGMSFSQPDALVEAALNVQFEEDDEYGSASSSNDDLNHPMTNREMFHDKNFASNLLSRDREDCDEKDMPLSEDCDDLPATTEAPLLDDRSVSLEEENRLLKEARQCKICMDAEVGIVFLPCGHLSTCVNCALNLEDCPLCRSAIKATVRTFLS